MAVGQEPDDQAAYTKDGLFTDIDYVIKVAPPEVALNPLKTQGRLHRGLLKSIVAFVVQRTADLQPSAPAGVSWVTLPGAPVITANAITEAPSVIRYNETNLTIAAKIIPVPFAATGAKRTDAIVINYLATPPVYERISGVEVPALNPVPDPTIPADRFFVRNFDVTDGAIVQAATGAIKSVLFPSGKTGLPNQNGLLAMEAQDAGNTAFTPSDTNNTTGFWAGWIPNGFLSVTAALNVLANKIGKVPLTTTAQTITGAIAELKTALGSVSSVITDRFEFIEVSIDSERVLWFPNKIAIQAAPKKSGNIASFALSVRAQGSTGWTSVADYTALNTWVTGTLTANTSYEIRVSQTVAAGGAGTGWVSIAYKEI